MSILDIYKKADSQIHFMEYSDYQFEQYLNDSFVYLGYSYITGISVHYNDYDDIIIVNHKNFRYKSGRKRKLLFTIMKAIHRNETIK